MPMVNIHFFFQDTKPALANRTALKIFLADLFREKGRSVRMLNYIFCTDRALREMNKKHLGHDYYTDIITFDLSTSKKELEAEIYISVDRVRENAQSFGSRFKDELHRVIFHGALHLLGHSDRTPGQKQQMRKAEDAVLDRYRKGST